MLPKDYRLLHDPDSPALVAPNKKVVCRFGPGATREAIEQAAHEHLARVDRGIRELEGMLRKRRRS